MGKVMSIPCDRKEPIDEFKAGCNEELDFRKSSSRTQLDQNDDSTSEGRKGR